VPSLETTYLGFKLRSPIVASAGPLTGDVDIAERLVDAGVSALVLPSLFEEEVVHEELELTSALEVGSGHFAEAVDYFPALDELPSVRGRYLANLERIKRHVTVPVVASLNATTPGGWARYARQLADAGADAIELNLYRVVADPYRRSDQVEHDDVVIVGDVAAAVDIPVAVKLSPYYSAMANFAVQVVHAGAGGLVLFNRFYQPDLDLETLDITPHLELSSAWELRLPLRWIAILRPILHGHAYLAATSGVETAADVAKALLVGADTTMMTSALLRHGPEHVRTVEADLLAWMVDRGYESVEQLRGSVSSATTDNPTAFERANYVRMLHSWTSPIGQPA
jgi:dihydroorotate dehydrogenase (fumarate)